MYVREVHVKYRLRRIRGSDPPTEEALKTPAAAAKVFTTLLGREIVEVCGLICLSAALEPIAYHELSRGTLNHTLVYPADVYRIALLTQAVAIVIGHNHPSGHPAPSPDDVALTRRLADAGRLIGVDVADHIIVTAEGRYFSFKEAVLL